IWATMSVSTMVWLVYCGVSCCGCDIPFLDLIDSELFTRSLTCGAVYGFLAGIVTFVMVYCGERITNRLSAVPQNPGRKNNRRAKNKNSRAAEGDEQSGEAEIIEEIMAK
ncbi:MAG: hypothetical protein MJ025_05705, partial [Victivallaceae bacterium]|nr:hypothetical protein [Victivallaceae bacterium]